MGEVEVASNQKPGLTSVDDYHRLRTLVSTWRQKVERDLGRDDPGLSLG